jgi:hypothetical protein
MKDQRDEVGEVKSRKVKMKIAKGNDKNAGGKKKPGESGKYETRCDNWRTLVYSSATSCNSKARTLTLLFLSCNSCRRSGAAGELRD